MWSLDDEGWCWSSASASVDHEQDHAPHFEHARAVTITLGSFVPRNTQKRLYNEDRYVDIDCDHLEMAKQNKHVVGKNGNEDFWNSSIPQDYADGVGCQRRRQLMFFCFA